MTNLKESLEIRKKVWRVKIDRRKSPATMTNLEVRHGTKRGWKLELGGVKKQEEVTDNNDESKSKMWHKERLGNGSLLLLSEKE